jgi:hypothetical protein
MVQIRLPNLCQDKFGNESGSVFIIDGGYNSGSKKKSDHEFGSGYNPGSSFINRSSYETGSEKKSSYGSGAGPESIYKSRFGTRAGS